MDNIKIFLNQNRSKKEINKPIIYNIDLKANKRLYTEENINGSVSSFETYNEERKRSNKIRLICNINPICSNVLFNPVTEIVKNEGDYEPFLLNYLDIANGEIKSKDGKYNPIKPKTTDNTMSFSTSDNKNFIWDAYEAIRDTQISSEDFGFQYHCGIDFFNNHLLRSNTFKIVSFNEKNSFSLQSDGRKSFGTLQTDTNHVFIDEKFNTIDDWMRDSHGNIVYNNFFNPYYHTKNKIPYKIIVNNFKGSNKIHNDYFATFDLTVNFGDNKIELKKNSTAYIEVLYGLYEKNHEGSDTKKYSDYGVYKRLERKSIRFEEDITTNELSFKGFSSNESISPYNTPKYLDRHVIGCSILSVNLIINNNSNNNNELTNAENVYYKNETETYNLIYIRNNDVAQDSTSKVSHLYQSYDLNTFKETIDKKLIENNGWFGFKNTSKLPTYDGYLNFKSHPYRKLDISKPINNKDASTFIDMYPGRDLYSFTPKYNKYKHRIEPNWDYCLTYPSSSISTGFDFIEENNNSLKIQLFDEFTTGDKGEGLITIYSITKHGLSIGDNVNIYSTFNGETTLLLANVNVANVYDNYIFQINRNSVSLSNKWVDVKDYPSKFIDNNILYSKDAINKNKYRDDTDKHNVYYVVPDTMKINLDLKTNNLSFKKVINGIECDYYVRIFSKLPNFKFSDVPINDETLYGKNGNNILEKYSTVDKSFESHVNQVGFSKNIFGDAINEIVFTDDIDLSYLKDNLGRPLTDIFLTIVKRNKGYKEWYGIGGNDINLKSDNIEYSHCFGKNSCSFRLSDDSIDNFNINDIRIIDSDHEGLNIKKINKTTSNIADEIIFDECQHFYGDLCCYSPYDVVEETIQPILNRFNTAQRDLNTNDKAYKYFSKIKVDDIINDESVIANEDPYTIHNTNRHSEQTVYDALPRNEGYYYLPHYKIRVNTVSSSLSERNGIIYALMSLVKNNSNFIAQTKTDNDFLINQKVLLYDNIANSIYICLIKEIINSSKFICEIFDENGNNVQLGTIDDLTRYCLVERDETIPYYAKLIKDGSCRFYWRDIIKNGFDELSDVEHYPFTNNALYINRNINFYLRRQNPIDKTDKSVYVNKKEITYEKPGDIVNVNETEDNYVNEKNMKEC